jgi:hypothetical protein
MGVVLSVGTRALVTPLAGTSGATLTDDNGMATGQTLAAGVEVEIVAWRAGGRSGNRYRVRCVDDGVEGWIGGAMLQPRPQPGGPRRPTRLPPGPIPRGGVSARPRRGGGGG